VTTGISWKKFHADVLAAMLGRWGALGAGFVTTMLLTRILPVADVGVYFIVLSLVLILGPLANVGLQEPTLRAIASFIATGDHARAAAVARSALKLGIATAGLLSALVAVVWAGLCKAGLFLTEQDLLTGAFVACWMAVVAVETQLVGTFQGLEKIRLAVLCDGALSKLLAMAAIAIMFVSRGRATVHEILLIFILCEAATVAVALFCLGPLISFSPEPALTASASDLLKTARPFLLHQLAALTSSQSDAIVLGLFRPAAQVAQYGTASHRCSLSPRPPQTCPLRRPPPSFRHNASGRNWKKSCKFPVLEQPPWRC
jgi:O-antigen/teichoic acid export membrane protein